MQGEKQRALTTTHRRTWTHKDTCAHTQRLNHFETFILSNQCFPFLKMYPPTKQGEDRQTHDADGRLWESVCAVISSVTKLADFPSLNYHLAQTSGAPQYHRQTAISTCPQRGHKMEKTYPWLKRHLTNRHGRGKGGGNKKSVVSPIQASN